MADSYRQRCRGCKTTHVFLIITDRNDSMAWFWLWNMNIFIQVLEDAESIPDSSQMDLQPMTRNISYFSLFASVLITCFVDYSQKFQQSPLVERCVIAVRWCEVFFFLSSLTWSVHEVVYVNVRVRHLQSFQINVTIKLEMYHDVIKMIKKIYLIWLKKERKHFSKFSMNQVESAILLDYWCFLSIFLILSVEPKKRTKEIRKNGGVVKQKE